MRARDYHRRIYVLFLSGPEPVTIMGKLNIITRADLGHGVYLRAGRVQVHQRR